MKMYITDISAGYLIVNKSKSITAKVAKELLRVHKEYIASLLAL